MALPKTTEDRIKADAEKLYPLIGDVKKKIGYIAGATAYTTKLHHVEQENAELRRQNEKMKAMATGWRPLLEEVLKNDAAFGKLPIKLIDKIKKFLYGE